MKRKLSDSSGTYRDLGFQARYVKFGFLRPLGSYTDLLEPVFVLSNFFQIGTYLIYMMMQRLYIAYVS